MNQPPSTKIKSRRTLKFIFVVLAVVMLFCSLPIGWLVWSGFSMYRGVKQSIVEADAGFRKATNTIDPETLRTWALQEIQNHSNTNGSVSISTSEIPAPIKNLYSIPPEDAESDGSTVTIYWGGGFFHWVIEIGSTNFSEPFNSGNSDYPYNFEWVKGIYYSREAAWKLQ